jgi:hypothetical protein
LPNSLISHQAPGLFLKSKYSTKFDGTALCISAFVPDLNLLIGFFFDFSVRNFTHSLLGQVIYNIPLTIILTMVFCRYISPFVSRIAKRKSRIYSPLRFFGIDEFDKLNKKQFNKKFFFVASYSALIGGLTHILLDLPAHEQNMLFFPLVMPNPDFLLYTLIDFGPIYIGPIRIDGAVTVFGLIWNIEDIILLISSLFLLRNIKKHNLISKWYNDIIKEDKGHLI